MDEKEKLIIDLQEKVKRLENENEYFKKLLDKHGLKYALDIDEVSSEKLIFLIRRSE